jgi:hypothetical protein
VRMRRWSVEKKQKDGEKGNEREDFFPVLWV